MKSNVNSMLVGGVIVLGLAALVGLGLSKGPMSIQGAASGKSVSSSRQIKIAVLENYDANGSRYTQVGTSSVEGLIEALERYGANIEMAEHEVSGVASLRVKVDGIQLSPIVTECKHCEPIIFEY